MPGSRSSHTAGTCLHSQERREFALCTRNGRSYTFRAEVKESFDMWTIGLQQFMSMARAYYALH